jgi:GntR family transcriptional regulator, trigonelline degradation regulator
MRQEKRLGTVEQLEVVAAPLRKQVAQMIREAITSFEFQPGLRLYEGELTKRYGVSRTVIREALRHLEAEGLIELVPNQGPVVATLTFNEAKELYEVRLALESMAAGLCASRGLPRQKRALAKALAEVEAVYSKSELADELRAKDHFYRVLLEGAGNQMLASMFMMIQARAQLLRGMSLQRPGRTRESLEELRSVVSAIQRGDADAARECATLHVNAARDAALEALEAQASDETA